MSVGRVRMRTVIMRAVPVGAVPVPAAGALQPATS